jgi:PKD repeat protein
LTNSIGVATTTFTVNYTSGSATINANLTNSNGIITTRSYVQNIDHDTPFYYTVSSPSQASAGTLTYFNISYTDQWGNIIDHRNPADPNTITLQIGSVAGNAAFVINGTYVTITTQQLANATGSVSVPVLLDYIAGQNNIAIQSFGAIPTIYPSIIGIANGVPVSITALISPSAVPADMVHTVFVVYTLYDKYGNPTTGQNITVQTSAGDSYPNLESNNFGQVGLTYGPRGTASNITITATAVSNTSVTSTVYATFYSTAPVDWALIADPQTMPSLDVNNQTVANVTAQVTDVMGNPVAGQTVTFSLGAPTYDNINDVVTSAPKITGNSAVTDSNGNAIVQFIPGGFTTNTSNKYYNPTATGNCSVTATWNGTQQNVLLTWKNYPYLSAFTSVSPLTVPVNGTVNVTVKLTGDGWDLTTNPIDVVILMDRSGSMSTCMGTTKNGNCVSGGTEEQNAQAGGAQFISLVNASNDRIALVSFSGYDSGANIDTTINQNLTNNFIAVNKSLYTLSPNGATGTRDGIYQSIAYLNANPNPNPRAVRAIVLLTDGDYNWLGDFLGRGTGYYPAPPSGYTGYSTNALEPNKYLYYNGLGGTLIPNAYFTGTASGTTVTFTDKSLGSPTSWNWSFGDNTYSTSQNPSHTYTKPSSGTKYYTVSETATNSAGTDTATSQSQYITVTSSGLTLTSSYGPSSVTYTTAPDEQLTAQNMSVYASNSGIRVYTISYYNSFDQQAISDMSILSNATGGFYANAPDAATLKQVYTSIAGSLLTAAGVNTQMTMNFQNVILNNVTVQNANVFNYVAANPGSTQITWQNGVNNNTDQTAQWQTNKTLIFNIGTINLGQTWQAVFELNITQAGTIQLFGNQSGTITFNNGTSSLQLPPVFITALANLTNNGATTQSILINPPLLVTQPGILTSFVPLQWGTTYPGSGLYTATERLYYSTSYQAPQTCGQSPWVGPFDTQTGIPVGQSNQYSSLDVRTLPAGTYYICVDATAPDAYPATSEIGVGAQVKESGKSYIMLQ